MRDFFTERNFKGFKETTQPNKVYLAPYVLGWRETPALENCTYNLASCSKTIQLENQAKILSLFYVDSSVQKIPKLLKHI